MTSISKGHAVAVPGAYDLSRMLQGAGLALLAFLAGNLVRSAEGGAGITDPLFDLIFIEDWKLSQYHFSYAELGFAKRALIGTLLDLGPGAPGGIFPLLLVCLLVTVFVFSALVSGREAWTRAALILSPAIFMQIGYDFGRFDLINTALLLLFVRTGGRFMVLFIPVMLLIHEGAIATHVPMLFLVRYLLHGIDRSLWLSALVAVGTLLGILTLSNNLSAADMAAIYPELNADSLSVLDQSLRENVYVALYRVYSMGLWERAGFALCLLYLALLAWPSVREGKILHVLVCLTPLALSLVALDFARWLALGCFNLALLSLVCAGNGEGMRAARLLPFGLLGPVGVFFPLPLLGLVFG